MSIQAGDRIPDVVLTVMSDDGPQAVPTSSYCRNRKVVLFSVPGAFTPTCSARHLPGFVRHADEFFDRGVDAIGCVAVNDVFVMHAWGQAAKADPIDMLADGNGEFAAALGLELDAHSFGMGTRSQRFALVAEDGVVTRVFIEAPGEFRVSAAEHVLANL
jgi:peroxiredoxin